MESCHFFTESDAAGAVDASVHVGDHQWTHVLILYGPFVLLIPTCLISVEVGVVLEVAFPALIADGAVQGMVSKEELHDTASCDSSYL